MMIVLNDDENQVQIVDIKMGEHTTFHWYPRVTSIALYENVHIPIKSGM
jgi:hypothetical protein